MANTNKNPRTFTGVVSSTAPNKTITVDVEARRLHPKYKKYYRTTRKYHVHDQKEEAKVGDQVNFIECRPLSKTKRWRLLKVVK